MVINILIKCQAGASREAPAFLSKYQIHSQFMNTLTSYKSSNL